jgi:phosphoribosylamine--glycine ligase
MEGPEVSVLSFTDGETLVPMVSSMDHKRALDGDKGPNTGGMGAVAPNAYYTKEIAAECMENIFLPTIRAMRAEGRPFRGCLYFGLMLTKSGPKVVEYNCRFGDPETQAVLPLLKSDLLTVMQATTNGTLADVSVEFSTDSACCVVLVSEGYPQKYESGFPITMSEEAAAHCYVAGAKKDSDTLLTAGGRVLGVTAVAPTLRAAVEDAYHLAEGVDFANKYCRGDIGSAALAAREERG